MQFSSSDCTLECRVTVIPNLFIINSKFGRRAQHVIATLEAENKRHALHVFPAQEVNHFIK